MFLVRPILFYKQPVFVVKVYPGRYNKILFAYKKKKFFNHHLLEKKKKKKICKWFHELTRDHTK